jgi:hypothetical protein
MIPKRAFIFFLGLVGHAQTATSKAGLKIPDVQLYDPPCKAGDNLMQVFPEGTR